MIFAYHACCAQGTKRYKIAPGACRAKLPTKMVIKPGLGARWTRFWRALGHSLVLLAGLGRLLGGSWVLLGSPEPALGTYLAALGTYLAGLGRHLEGFWSPGPPRAFILKGFGVSRGCVFRWLLLLLALCYLMLFF